MKPTVCSARGSRGPGGSAGSRGGHRSCGDRCIPASSAQEGPSAGLGPARPRPCRRGRRASAGAPAGSSRPGAVDSRSARRRRAAARRARAARQPASSSIRSLATTTAGWRRGRRSARACWRRAGVLEVAIAAGPPAARSSTTARACRDSAAPTARRRVISTRLIANSGRFAATQRAAAAIPAPTSPPRASPGDQREEPLGVGLARTRAMSSPSSARGGRGPRSRRCGRTAGRPARTGGCSRSTRAGGGVADVGDERASSSSSRPRGRTRVLVGGERLLGHAAAVRAVEQPEAGAVGLAAALLRAASPAPRAARRWRGRARGPGIPNSAARWAPA